MPSYLVELTPGPPAIGTLTRRTIIAEDAEAAVDYAKRHNGGRTCMVHRVELAEPEPEPTGEGLRFETVSVPVDYPPELEAVIDRAREARARMLDDVEATLGADARRAFEDAEDWAMDAALYGVRIVDTQGRRVDPSTIHVCERGVPPLDRRARTTPHGDPLR